MPHLKPALTLYRGFAPAPQYVWSPFVTKLETLLRFSGLSYRMEAGSPMKGPRGKIPYLAVKTEAVDEPLILSDSTLIATRFVEDGMMDDLHGGLDPVLKAQDLALRAMCEDRLYWYQGYERWQQNYYTMRSNVLSFMPYPLQVVIGLMAYRKNMQTLHGQGTSRFSAEEISIFKRELWESIEALLAASTKAKRRGGNDDGEEPFWVLGGGQPTEADATVYGFVASGLICKAGPESRGIIRSLPAVMEYARRIHNRYFPDYEGWEEDDEK